MLGYYNSIAFRKSNVSKNYLIIRYMYFKRFKIVL